MVKVAVSMVANTRDGRVDKYQTRQGMGYCFRVWRSGQLATCAVKNIDESNVVKALTKFREIAEALFRHQQDISSRNSRILLQRAIIDVAGGTAATIHFHSPKPKDAFVSPAAVEAPITAPVLLEGVKLNGIKRIMDDPAYSPAQKDAAIRAMLAIGEIEKLTPEAIAQLELYRAMEEMTKPNKAA